MRVHDFEVKTFYVSSATRDKTRYPNSSSFTFELPYTIKNVVGFGLRNYKFRKETLVNDTNRSIMFNIDSGNVTGTVNVPKGDYTISALLDAINTEFAPYGMVFSLVDGVVAVQIDNIGVSNVALYPSYMMRMLGFSTGVFIRRPGSPAAQPPSDANFVTVLGTLAAADTLYEIGTVSDMVLRINNIETIMSNDSVTNRSSMIIYTDNDTNYCINRNADEYLPLLQMQHRLQTLRIELRNTRGELYDTQNYDTSFIFQFYCIPETKDTRLI